MTKQINSKETISGTSIMQIRDFFRHVASWQQESFGLLWLKERLSIDEDTASVLAQKLVAQGYIERALKDEYRFTDKGYDLVQASAAGKVTRKTAKDALVGLLYRVEQYNSDPDKILTVKAVAVFGSFLGQSQHVGDLDVAVKHEDRNLLDPNRAETALAYARKSRRQFGTFVDQLAWAQTELRQILKARKRTIKLQDWNSFVRIVADDPVRVPYKVLFGCPEEVDIEIEKVRASKQPG